MKTFFVAILLLTLTSCSDHTYTATTSESLSCEGAIDSEISQEGTVPLVAGGYLFRYGMSTCFVDPTFKKVSTILSSRAPHSTQRQYLALSSDLSTAYFMEITIDNKKDIKNGFIIKKLPLEGGPEVEIQQFFTSKEIFSAKTRMLDEDQIYIKYEVDKAVLLNTSNGTVVETPAVENYPYVQKYMESRKGKFTHPLNGRTWEVPEVAFAYDTVSGVLNMDDTKIVLTYAKVIDEKTTEIHLFLWDMENSQSQPKEIASGTYPIEFSASDRNAECLRYYWPEGTPKDMGIIQETCEGQDTTAVYSYNEATNTKTRLPFKHGDIFEIRD